MSDRQAQTGGLRRNFGLSSRLLALTILFVMLAEVLIFVPSVANFRNNWLGDRLASAQTAALVLEAAPEEALPEELVRELLKSVGAETIALRIKGTRRLLAISDMPATISESYDLRTESASRSIMESFQTLLVGGPRMLRVIGKAPMDGDFVEIVIREAPLREALIGFTWNILLLSLFISSLTAALVFFTLRRVIVRPVERLTASITRFADNPEDQTKLMQPSGRTDEIGRAESAVAGMQQTLSQQLKQKEHLAALGLAVSKVNHDLRNLLASAQLISDRLSTVMDPTVQRFAPKLIQTLDRAIAFCQSTLAYGRAEERRPDIRPIRLYDALEEARDLVGLDEDNKVMWQNSVPRSLEIRADSEHLARIISNLFRNALQAMDSDRRPDGARHVLFVNAMEYPERWTIDIADTGSGIPAHIRDKLFDAFRGSTRPGGTGLGLAISSELARAMGGKLELAEATQGTAFRLTLPKPGT
jgi:signal transduction histidine kinase